MHRLLIVTAVLLFSISNFGSINAADPPPPPPQGSAPAPASAPSPPP